MARQERITFIYFIQAGVDGPIKIGHAQSPERRRATLQTSHPETLTLIGKIKGPPSLEREWHNRFAHLRIRGEWFRRDYGLLAAIAASKMGKQRTAELLIPPHIIGFVSRRLRMPDLADRPDCAAIIAEFMDETDDDAPCQINGIAAGVQTHSHTEGAA